MGATKIAAISDDGLTRLIEREALVDGLYDDASGYGTYGVGHLVHNPSKWKSFLLAAAKENATWRGLIQSSWGVDFLPRSARSAGTFAELKKSAVAAAEKQIGTKQYGASYAKLTAAQKMPITRSAQAAVDAEAALLQKDPKVVMREDLVPFQNAVRNGATQVELTQQEYDALVSIAFNIGTEGFRTSTLLKKINENLFRNGDAKARKAAIDEIEAQFLAWNKSNGVVLKGLQTRRKNEATQFLEEARAELAKLSSSSSNAPPALKLGPLP